MALKPPPLGDVIQQMNELVGASGLRKEVDRGVRHLANAAMARLDVVSREEFDAQAEVLQRTKARVAALEAGLETLARELEALEQAQPEKNT
ncbi:MAG: accessory factor UbiK family protein [Parahaliea sp.]